MPDTRRAGFRKRVTTRRPVPRYPHVRVRVSILDGPVGILIGKVAVALRHRVGGGAADEFNHAGHACATCEDLMHLVRATVRTR
jgi:hypothetical protein